MPGNTLLPNREFNADGDQYRQETKHKDVKRAYVTDITGFFRAIQHMDVRCPLFKRCGYVPVGRILLCSQRNGQRRNSEVIDDDNTVRLDIIHPPCGFQLRELQF